MPTVRTKLTLAARLKMILGGIALFFGCIWLWPLMDTEAAKTFLAIGALVGPVAVIGGVIGLQDHKL